MRKFILLWIAAYTAGAVAIQDVLRIPQVAADVHSMLDEFRHVTGYKGPTGQADANIAVATLTRTSSRHCDCCDENRETKAWETDFHLRFLLAGKHSAPGNLRLQRRSCNLPSLPECQRFRRQRFKSHQDNHRRSLTLASFQVTVLPMILQPSTLRSVAVAAALLEPVSPRRRHRLLSTFRLEPIS